MSDMFCAIATLGWAGYYDCLLSWTKNSSQSHRAQVVLNKEVLPAYQSAYLQSTETIVAFIHDDVMIHEKGWDERVLNEFNNPAVGLVGFGGALGHGTPDLYTSPYNLPKLARQGFLSNMRDAEKHGQRFTKERDVAVLDGFALFVRRSILDKVGGWPLDKPVGYYMYSEWLCCETRRQGYRIRLVGVDCDHLGGRSASMVQLTDNYEEAHRYFYENNRDVMPYRVEEQ